MKLPSVLKKTVITIAVLLGVAEAGVRFSGLTDIPAYAVDDGIGYIVRPDQAGRFLNKNAWAFNSRSMPTEAAWEPGKRPNIMVIGNSIIMGGNPLDQKDKLVPQIAKDIGPHYAVWPLGIGGWTTVNEMVYLDRNPDVVKATNFFVWEYMPGGLSGLSQWRGDYVFPRERPLWATGYVLRRYVLPRFFHLSTSELPPTGSADARNLADFDQHVALLSKSSGLKRPGMIFLYPEKKDLVMARRSTEWLPERKELQDLASKYNLILVDVAQDASWTESLYRDGTHPTVEGNVVLARIISNAMRDALNEGDVSIAETTAAR